MTKFFLSSHGRLASGIGSSLDILLGGHDRLTCFDSYIDEHSLNDALLSSKPKINRSTSPAASRPAI